MENYLGYRTLYAASLSVRRKNHSFNEKIENSAPLAAKHVIGVNCAADIRLTIPLTSSHFLRSQKKQVL